MAVLTAAMLTALVSLVWHASNHRDGSLLRVAPVVVPVPPVVREPAVAQAAAAVPGPEIVSPAWVSATAVGSGIPPAAVRAYGSATLRIAHSDPSCRLSWTTLAGIGWVESQHGTLDHRVLGDDGRSSRPIVGPALDGSGAVARMRTPDGSWVRAVGPLQFLPSTWGRWASDGDGDGVRDPDDLDDAAFAAGRYLCAAGGDLSTGPGWSTAVLAYNHAATYVRAVYDAAVAYADRTS